jgi:protein-disulfide isomerase
MAKKTVEIELPELKDSTMIYLLAAVIILAQVSTTYFTMQVNQNVQTMATAIKNIKIAAPSGNPSPAPSPSPQPAPQPTVVDVSEDDDAVRGPANAPVEIIEFSDYQCPYCERAYPTVQQILRTYGDKVKFIYRDFPLSSLHPYAQKAAEAAECAGEQGKYWEMHDKLFENQGALDVPSLKQYAADLGLDTAAFNSCLDNGDMASEVQNDFNDGQAAGVSGTPTFFINGKMLVGAQPFDAFKAVIDAELA